MQIKEILYVEPVDCNFHEQDPIVIALKNKYDNIPIVVFKESSQVLSEDIVRHVKSALAEGKCCVTVINVFLRPEKEGVVRNSWYPDDSTLRELLDCRKDSGYLFGLKLLWQLWPKIRSDAFLFVTSNRVRMTVRSWFMLKTAFCDGQVCFLYNWSEDKQNQLYIQTLIEEEIEYRF